MKNTTTNQSIVSMTEFQIIAAVRAYRMDKDAVMANGSAKEKEEMSATIESMDEVVQTIDPSTIEYMYLIKFADMPAETLADIYAELSNATTIFATDADVRRALGACSRKINPTMLNGGYSIYLSIREEKLSAYYNLIQLIMEKQKISSVVRLYVILNNFFKSARKDGIIVSNPMEMIDRPVPRKDEIKKEAPEFYTEEEVARILSIMQNEPLKWRGYMSVLIDTGIRRGECCGIQWENVDFRNNKIAIKGSLNYTSSRGVYLDTPKGKKERTVYISQGTASLLQEIRESQANSSKWVFTRDGSTEPMHPDSPTKYMERLSKRAGIENLHPHKLRHTFASIALINGADVVSVSELLGHSDTSVTLRTYAHASEKSKQRAFNTFQDAIHAGIKEDAAADADKTLLKSKSEKPISQHIKEEKLTSSHHKRR